MTRDFEINKINGLINMHVVGYCISHENNFNSTISICKDAIESETSTGDVAFTTMHKYIVVESNNTHVVFGEIGEYKGSIKFIEYYVKEMKKLKKSKDLWG